ncbi:WD repeat-containing and planar cell polarity effector protein fritz isoform X2 [Athalia rosae]|nr:WD repeat-containing and planar cell polarity effector protein fritz isoform X2 [Athalia rosae]
MSDVIITKSHFLCTYNDNQVTLVYFTKPKRHVFEKISRLDPKLLLFELTGPNGRRLDKKIHFNKTADLILIWWKSTMNEVFPWSPVVKEHDRANVHLYRLIGTKVELICFLRTEFDPLCVTFSTYQENIIHSVEQKVSRKGEVTIEWRVYEVSPQGKLQRLAVTSVPLPTHTSCIKFSPNHDMLLLCCIDGSVTLHDQTKGTNNSIKASFIPTLASWHSDGIAFTVSNERGQFQHFDISLSCLKSQILSEDTTPANILDLSSYFRNQPTLLRMEWSKGISPHSCPEPYEDGDSLFLLFFERGPLGIIKFIEGSSLSGDVLVRRYLNLSQVERATSLLLAMNWDTHPQVCMHSLNQISNFLFKLPLIPEREGLIQNALGSFHVPVRPISQVVQDEYGEEVRDLTRRFFHHLLRYRLFEKAFRLAIDLNDHDLFMDIHFYALITNDTGMATVAKEKAENILLRSNSCSSTHSTCSRPSCSLCSSSSESHAESESYSDESESECLPTREKRGLSTPSRRSHVKSINSHIPPLPVLHPHLCSKSNLMSTSFNEIKNPIVSSHRTDSNLMSTAFNVPSSNLASESFSNPLGNSISHDSSTSTSFSNTNPLLVSTSNSTKHPRSFNDVIGDLMSTSFSNLTVNNSVQPVLDHPPNGISEKSLESKTNTISTPATLNSVSTNARFSTIFQESDNLTTTLFNSPAYDTTSFDSMSNKSLSFSCTEPSIISTSFSTPSSKLSSKSYSDLYNGFNPINKFNMNAAPMLHQVKSPSFNAPPANSLASMLFNNSVTTVKPSATSFYNPNSSLMSTSFGNELIPDLSDSPKDSTNHSSIHGQPPIKSTKIHSSDVPPPPCIRNSYNYVHNLPSKNYQLSQSTLGLADVDETVQQFPSRPPNLNSKVLQRQNSITTILQNHQKNSNKLQSTRTYRVNYDLDFIPFYGSCDNLSSYNSNENYTKTDSASINHVPLNTRLQTKLGESKHLKQSFLQNCANLSMSKEQKISSNIPPLPIINSPFSNPKSNNRIPNAVETSTSTEKPKVKFSDTVTHILVPGTGQPYRPVQKRSLTQLHPMDPKRELAESLPLCLGNEDYLKDFQPLSKDCEDKTIKEVHQKQPDEAAKIKIVHFGLL